jgi:hypothetical protein
MAHPEYSAPLLPVHVLCGWKVCYISEDYWRRHGRRPAVKVSLCLAADKVFGIPRYAETIEVGVGLLLLLLLLPVTAFDAVTTDFKGYMSVRSSKQFTC